MTKGTPTYANVQYTQSYEERKETMEGFARNPKGIVLVCGPPGVGKTYNATEIYHCRTSYKLPEFDADQALFILSTDLYHKWLEAVRDSCAHLLLDTYKRTPLLILDDIGSRKPSEGFMEFLLDLIDWRYTRRLEIGTMITTNCNIPELIQLFGERFVSRICYRKVVVLIGKDKRFGET